MNGQANVNKENSNNSEFYFDLLQVFGDNNGNYGSIPTANQKPNNPTIIRPAVAPRHSIKARPKPKPRAPAIQSGLSIPSHSTTVIKKKKVPPPRPAPPKITKTRQVSSSKVPPSYSKVLEEDIRACIDAYSSKPKNRSSSSSSEPARPVTITRISENRAHSLTDTSDLINLNTPHKKQSEMNIQGVTVTGKNLKQAGAAASFLNKNPKLAKHVVPPKYKGAVKVVGKTHDFREQHKHSVKTFSSKKNDKPETSTDLLGSLEPNSIGSVDFSNESHQASKLPRPTSKPKPPVKPKLAERPPVPQDFNDAWGDDCSSAAVLSNETETRGSSVENFYDGDKGWCDGANKTDKIEAKSESNVIESPLSPTIPEPLYSPPVLTNLDESLPSLEPQAIALFNYTASKADEISFQAKDIIMLLKEDGERFYGKFGTKEGYFPKVSVDVLSPLPYKDQELKYRALEKYSAKQPFEISFEKGDIIILDSKIDDVTFEGKVERTGSFGEFSASYVQILDFDENLATVLYDYDGDTNSGDLNLKAGNKVKILHQINSNWLYGQCDGKTGQFPASFVDNSLMESNNPDDKSKECPNFKILREVTALYSFQGSVSDELSFQKDDMISIVEEVDSEWLKGFVNGNSKCLGLFPKTYVEWIENKKEEFVVKALYKFDATSPDELSFEENDVITVIEEVNDDWMIGRLNGAQGLFPSSFVNKSL